MAMAAFGVSEESVGSTGKNCSFGDKNHFFCKKRNAVAHKSEATLMWLLSKAYHNSTEFCSTSLDSTNELNTNRFVALLHHTQDSHSFLYLKARAFAIMRELEAGRCILLLAFST